MSSPSRLSPTCWPKPPSKLARHAYLTQPTPATTAHDLASVVVGRPAVILSRSQSCTGDSRLTPSDRLRPGRQPSASDPACDDGRHPSALQRPEHRVEYRQ